MKVKEIQPAVERMEKLLTIASRVIQWEKLGNSKTSDNTNLPVDLKAF